MDLTTLLISTTIDQVKAAWDAFATNAKLGVTAWWVGSKARALRETTTQILNAYVAQTDVVIRSQWLPLATDPGDVDPYNANNASATPAKGWLSALGENTYTTTRAEATSAVGFIVMTNNSGAPYGPFAPYALTFQRSVANADGSYSTYRNASSATIYTGGGGTYTLAAGASVLLPVIADLPGSKSNAAIGEVTILQTNPIGIAVTNSSVTTGGVTYVGTTIVGTDREPIDTYRLRCLQSASRLSLSGPSAAISYFATKNTDGTPLLNANGTPVNITRVYVSQSSATGQVTAYYASASGAAISADVTAANTNITSQAWATPNCITFTGAAATAQAFAPSGSVEIKNGSGGLTGTALQTAVQNAIASALTTYFSTFPIGGVDQTAGAGVIYTADVQTVVANAYAGIYKPTVTVPAGASTAVAAGNVVTYTSAPASWTVTLT